MAELMAESNRDMPESKFILANSTINIAFLAAMAISITKEIWAKMLFSKVGLANRANQRINRAPKIAKGVPSRILQGKDQLSY